MLIQSPALASLKRVRHAFFTRKGGVSEGVYASLNGGLGSKDDTTHVRENRKRMTAALEVAEDALAVAFQIHSPDAVVATHPWTHEERPRADAVVSSTPGLAVGVTIADCGPVLLAEEAAGVVAAVHAGWKGALDGVIESAVAAMVKLGAQRPRIVAAIGPLIRKESYEVGLEFVARFRADDPGNRCYFSAAEQPGHAMFDLPGYIAHKLLLARIGMIQDLGLDSYADETHFYSFRRSMHRKEPDYGRLVAAITIEKS